MGNNGSVQFLGSSYHQTDNSFEPPPETKHRRTQSLRSSTSSASNGAHTTTTAVHSAPGVINNGSGRPSNGRVNLSPDPSKSKTFFQANDGSNRSNNAKLHTKPGGPRVNPRALPSIEPLFKVENMDNRIKGHYHKNGGRHHMDYNKENAPSLFDKNASRLTSAMNSRSGSPGTSEMPSAASSKYTSRQTSFKRYKRKKYPAPSPPIMENTASARSSGRSHKKRRAPSPPRDKPENDSQIVEVQNTENIEKLPSDANITEAIEKPIVNTESLAPGVVAVEIRESNTNAVPSLDLTSVTPDVEMREEYSHDTVVYTAVNETAREEPRTDRSESPPPPPVPPKMPDILAATSSPPQGVAVNTSMQAEIMRAAQKRAARRDKIIEEARAPSFHDKFAEELAKAVKVRDERRVKGTVRMRQYSYSNHFPATFSAQLKRNTNVNNMLDVAGAKGQEQAAIEEEKRRNRMTFRVLDEEWTPEIDLDGAFDEEDNGTSEALTARGGDYYNRQSALSYNNEKHFKKKEQKSKSRHSKKGADKVKKSIRTAFGSIGKGLVKDKQRKPIGTLFDGDEGWTLYHNDEFDTPSSGPIEIDHIEKHPAYAYHAEKEQLILLPDHDKIFVTKDGKKYREDMLTKNEEYKKTISNIGNKVKERPALHVDESMILTQRECDLMPERKEQELMELQFEQVRKLNKQFNNTAVNDVSMSVPPPPPPPPPPQTASVVMADTSQNISLDDKEDDEFLDKLERSINKLQTRKQTNRKSKQKSTKKRRSKEQTSDISDDEPDTSDSYDKPAQRRLNDSGYKTDLSIQSQPSPALNIHPPNFQSQSMYSPVYHTTAPPTVQPPYIPGYTYNPVPAYTNLHHGHQYVPVPPVVLHQYPQNVQSGAPPQGMHTVQSQPNMATFTGLTNVTPRDTNQITMATVHSQPNISMPNDSALTEPVNAATTVAPVGNMVIDTQSQTTKSNHPQPQNTPGMDDQKPSTSQQTLPPVPPPPPTAQLLPQPQQPQPPPAPKQPPAPQPFNSPTITDILNEIRTTQNETEEEITAFRKRLLLAPAGYRPVKFNPNNKTSVTMPHLNKPQQNSSSSPHNQEQTSVRPETNQSKGDVHMDKSDSNLSSEKHVAVTGAASTSAAGETEPKPEDIPNDIIEKYGHEDLVAL